jgi:hypothetical protein
MQFKYWFLLSYPLKNAQSLSTATDNPLLDGETGHVHHGGNFQAMAITNAMEKTRLALHHIGKLLFSQSTELLNRMSFSFCSVHFRLGMRREYSDYESGLAAIPSCNRSFPKLPS